MRAPSRPPSTRTRPAPRTSNDGIFPVRNGDVLTATYDDALDDDGRDDLDGRRHRHDRRRRHGHRQPYRPPCPASPPASPSSTPDLIGSPDFTVTVTGPGG